MVFSVIVQIHLQRLELRARRAQACEEREVEERVVIEDQLLDPVDVFVSDVFESACMGGNIRMAMAIQVQTQQI